MSDVSPDILTPYVDLAVYDRDPQTIFDVALAIAAEKLPGWEPREGHTEVALLEGIALEVSELVFAINRVPALTTQLLLALFGVARDEGGPATATATFALADAFGHTIPAGTLVRLELDVDLVVDFRTDVDAVAAPGESSVVTAITATQNGAEAHGATAGTPLRLLDAVTFVEAVTLATAPSGGRSAESDNRYLDRGVQTLSRLVSSLVLPEHFTAAALADPRVGRATTLDNYDPTAGSGAPGDHPGHVTVVVSDTDGAPLGAGVASDLELAFEDDTLANLDVHVVAPTVTAVPVTVTVKRRNGYAAADVQAAVIAAIDAYLDPATWPWSETVRRNELIALIDGVDGVDYVDALAAPAADVALTGVANLVDAGAIAVTVT